MIILHYIEYSLCKIFYFACVFIIAVLLYYTEELYHFLVIITNHFLLVTAYVVSFCLKLLEAER